MPRLIKKSCMPKSGYRQVVPLAKKPLEYLGFGLASISAGSALKFDTGCAEWAIVILSGSIRAFGAEAELTRGPLGSRKDVFSGKASAIYLPPHFKTQIEAITPTQLALCQALACEHSGRQGEPGAPAVITPDDVRARTVGAHNWERTVQDIVDPRIPAARLLVGETINKAGCWSSYPPHRHDEDRLPLEASLEEIYFFQVNPPQGFGFQRVYTDDRRLDESYAVENGDTVILPRGYHPVAAAPGYQVYYLWLLAGTGRVMCPFDDPQHAWVRGLETGVKEVTE